MLSSIVFLFLVPLISARSAVNPDHHMTSHFDRNSRSPLANLFLGIDTSFPGIFDQAGIQESAYKVRSTGGDYCYCICVDAQSTGNTGCYCVCEDQQVPDIESECLLACKLDEDKVNNVCLNVCPHQKSSNIHTKRDVPVSELTDGILQRSEFKMLSGHEHKCEGVELIWDETRGNIGGIAFCKGHEIPPTEPECLWACQLLGSGNLCMIVCSI